MPEYKGVAVFCEVASGHLLSISTEGLGAGRKLADDLGQELSAVLIGSGVGDMAKEAIAYGADKVYVVDDPLLKDYQTDSYVAAMQKVVEKAAPQVLIMGQNDIGGDLAPRLAFRLETTVTMDCVDLAIDSGSKRLLRTKPVYGGNALAVFTGDTDPQIVTIRTKALTPLEPDNSRQGETVNVEAGIDASVMRTKLLERIEEEVAGIRPLGAEIAMVRNRMKGIESSLVDIGNMNKYHAGVSAGKMEGFMIGLTFTIAILGMLLLGR